MDHDAARGVAGRRAGPGRARRGGAGAVRFLVSRGGRGVMRRYLSSWRDTLEVDLDYRTYRRALGPERPFRQGGWRRVAPRLLAWEERARLRWLADWPARGPRTFVFADVERLTWAERERAAVLHERLSERPDVGRILNHPTRSLCRYELLRRLHRSGINDFQAYRVTEGVVPDRFPVFLRREDDHRGPTSELIHSPEALEAELERRARQGELREGRLIVEFCDTADESGRVRKFGAFRIGDRIVPRHVFVSKQWMVKEESLDDGIPAADLLTLQLEYLESNPHAAELMRLFELADIEYGRIDYGLKDGRIQVWEINTNPTVLDAHHRHDPRRGPAHRLFAQRFSEALAALAPPD